MKKNRDLKKGWIKRSDEHLFNQTEYKRGYNDGRSQVLQEAAELVERHEYFTKEGVKALAQAILALDDE